MKSKTVRTKTPAALSPSGSLASVKVDLLWQFRIGSDEARQRFISANDREREELSALRAIRNKRVRLFDSDRRRLRRE